MPPLKLLRHEKLAHNIVSHKDVTEAYAETYKTTNKATLQSASSTVLKKFPQIRERVIELLQTNPKASLENVLNHTVNDLTATKEIVYKGQIMELKDNEARGKAQDRLYKLHGAYDSAEEGRDQYNTQVNINISPEDQDKLAQIANLLSDINNKIGLSQ